MSQHSHRIALDFTASHVEAASTLPASIAAQSKRTPWAKLAVVSLLAAAIFGGEAASAQTSSSGSVIVADQLQVLAGGGNRTPSTRGTAGTNARIAPGAIARDAAGNIYIADQTGSLIEELDTNGNLTVIAGGGHTTPSSFRSTQPTDARLSTPQGIAVDANGNVYIADTGNHLVEELSTNGFFTTFTVIAGGGNTVPTSSGTITPTNAKITPQSLAVDANGNVYISDSQNQLVEKVTNGSHHPALSVIAGGGSTSLSDAFASATSVSLAPRRVLCSTISATSTSPNPALL